MIGPQKCLPWVYICVLNILVRWASYFTQASKNIRHTLAHIQGNIRLQICCENVMELDTTTHRTCGVPFFHPGSAIDYRHSMNEAIPPIIGKQCRQVAVHQHQTISPFMHDRMVLYVPQAFVDVHLNVWRILFHG